MEKYLVKPKSNVLFSKFKADDRSCFDGEKGDGQKYHKELRKKLIGLQSQFYADSRFKMLVVFQALDTGGKDGTIRNVFKGVNPQGVQVASFKKPTEQEFSYDFLWRVHKEVPNNGKIVVFNRSHYEDVLVPKVHKLVPPATINRRYEHINAFEKMLNDEGTVILKFFLNISKLEQKERLQARLDDPKKHWKFNPDDLKERQLWSEYQKAYASLLSKTSQTYAPWYIVPANSKWYRNIVVTRIIVEYLERLKLKYPAPTWKKGNIKIV